MSLSIIAIISPISKRKFHNVSWSFFKKIGYSIGIINKVIKKVILKGQRAGVLKSDKFPTMHYLFWNSDWLFLSFEWGGTLHLCHQNASPAQSEIQTQVNSNYLMARWDWQILECWTLFNLQRSDSTFSVKRTQFHFLK